MAQNQKSSFGSRRFARASLFLGAFSVLMISQLAWGSEKDSTSILARINERVITKDEFNKRFEQNAQLVPGKAPSKQEVLKNIVYFELATQEAKRMHLDKDQALKDQFDILLYQAIVRRYIQPKIDSLDVSESDTRKYYESNPLLKTSHIILLSRPGMSEKETQDLRKRASEILQEVKSGTKPFADLARKHSEGPSARTGGDVDWGARHKLLPEYYEAALKLKNIGDVSDLVETPYGIHIIQLNGRKSYGDMDSVYRDFITRTIREQKGQKIYADYFEELKKKAQVSVNEKLLNNN